MSIPSGLMIVQARSVTALPKPNNWVYAGVKIEWTGPPLFPKKTSTSAKRRQDTQVATTRSYLPYRALRIPPITIPYSEEPEDSSPEEPPLRVLNARPNIPPHVASFPMYQSSTPSYQSTSPSGQSQSPVQTNKDQKLVESELPPPSSAAVIQFCLQPAITAEICPISTLDKVAPTTRGGALSNRMQPPES